MTTLFENCTILSMDPSRPQRYFTGCVGVAGHVIEMVSDSPLERRAFLDRHKDGAEIIDATGKVLMPGLINTHSHGPMALLRNYSDDLALDRWLNESIWPVEAFFTRDDMIAGTRLGALEMLLGGTTCFVDMYFQTEAIGEACEEMGIRAHLASTLLSGNMSVYSKDMEAGMAKFARSRLVRMWAGPHCIYTNDADDLREAVRFARENSLGLHIHHNETPLEEQLVRQRYGMSPTEFLESIGVFECRTLLAHCVYMPQSDIDILARYPNVSVSHNPQSNMKLSSGIAPVMRMLQSGVNVTIGTDSAASNNSLDMWEEMRSASLMQKVSTMDPCSMDAYSTLECATSRAARAIGMEDCLGMVREGYLADLVLVSMEGAHMWPHSNPVAALVYCAKSSDVDSVMVDGRMLVRDGKLLSGRGREICLGAQSALEGILSRKAAGKQS